MDLDVNEALQAVITHAGAQVKTVQNTDVLVIPNGQKVVDVSAILDKLERTKDAPYRRRGTFEADTLISLTTWAIDNIDGIVTPAPLPETPAEDAPPVTDKVKALTFFARGLGNLGKNWKEPTLSVVVIGNYSKGAEAAWHDFKGEYHFPVSPQWKDWAANNATVMGQADFAKFIEEHLTDLGMPPAVEDYGEIVSTYLSAFENVVPATPSDIIRLSRGLEMTANLKATEQRDYVTGQGTLMFSEEHTTGDGKKMAIPPLFFIKVTVFLDSPEILVPVRLRYRFVQNSGVKWFYELLRPEEIVKDMFLACTAQLVNSGHTVLHGEPDVPPAR